MRFYLMLFMFINVMLCMLINDISNNNDYDADLIMMKLMKLMLMMLKI